MNTKTISYSDNSIVKSVSFVWVAGIFSNLTALIARSDLEKAQAHYNLKRKHQAQGQMQRGIVQDLPLEQKLQLGCYHLMD